MRLLLDQGLPRAAAKLLNGLGFVAEHVSDIGLARATDAEILAEARRRTAWVVTLDADFHKLLAITGASSPSVIRIRIERLKGPAVADVITRTAKRVANELRQGAAVSVTIDRIRVRLLPIG